MVDDPVKAVLAQLPPLIVKHPAKVKELRAQWDLGCAQIFKRARHLTTEQRIRCVMEWLHRGGVRDWVMGKLILTFARPLPVPATEDQKKERLQRNLVRNVYKDDLPHLRAVTRVVAERLETTDVRKGSFAKIDQLDDREQENPGSLFAEFLRSIDDRATIEYDEAEAEPFSDAAE